MNQTIFNEYGEPIGTERTPDPIEETDMNEIYPEEPDYDDSAVDCHFCNRTIPERSACWFEIDGEEFAACGFCENLIP